MRYEVLLHLLFVGLATLAVAGPVVDQWGLGTNGVHSNPVFRFKPEIRWSFDGNATAAGFNGIIPLNADEKTLYISNGSGKNPAIWKMTWDGEIVMQYNYTGKGTFAFDGTISVRNGVIYIYNDDSNTLQFFAIDEASQTILWNTPVDSTDYSSGPIVWSQDESYFAFATSSQVVALNASNGALLWQYPINYEFNSLPMIYSKLDDTLVWMTNTQELVKVSMKTGTEIWRNTDLQYDPQSNQPLSVAIDDAGNIYGGTPSSAQVYKVAMNGTMLWATTVDYRLAYSSTVLTADWIFIIDNSQGAVYSINAANGTVYLAYNNEDPDSGTHWKWITGQVFWSQNVLYGSFQGVIAAYDTTDPSNVKQLWTIETGAGESTQGGIAIAADGTMFLTSTMYDASWPLLISVGCPLGLHLKPDGTECVQCYAGYVLNMTTQQCDKCPQGTFSNDGDAQCTACTEDPNNPQCVLPPVEVPAVNEPVADVPVAAEVPLTAPVKSPLSKTNSASKMIGSLAISLLLLATI